MKFDNRLLGIVFLVLLALFIVKKWVYKPKTSSFDKIVLALDTASVDRITITKGTELKVELNRSTDRWMVVSAGADTGSGVPANSAAINALLSSCVEVEADQLVARSKDKWAAYELDETVGNRVEFYEEGKLLGSLVTGRFNFNQTQRTATSYIRRGEGEDIFAVDGFLAMGLDRQADDFMDKRLFRNFNPAGITRIEVNGNAGSLKVDRQADGMWKVDSGIMLDSMTISGYLTALGNAQASEISTIDLVGDDPMVQFSFSDATAAEPFQVNIYDSPEEEGMFLVRNTRRPDFLFVSDSTGLYKTLYTDFLPLLN